MKKRVLAIGIGVIASIMSLSASEYVLKFSHPKGKAALYFEKRLEELSKGRIDVQVYQCRFKSFEIRFCSDGVSIIFKIWQNCPSTCTI